MVELYINDKLCDLSGDEEIGIDYTIFNIENIKSKKSARSYTFSLPKTAKNKAIFENPDDVNSLSEIPYTKQKAKLFVNGVDINISYCFIDSSDSSYNINLYGGPNADFFTYLKENRFADVNICAFNHFWTKTNIANSRTNTSGYIYPIINYISDVPNGINNLQRNIQAEYMFPALFYDSVLDEIVAKFGYTLDNKLLNNNTYNENKLLLCYGGDELSHNGDVSFYKGKFSTSAIQSAQYSIGNDLFFDFDTISQSCNYWQNILTLVSTVFNFQASVKVKGNLSWNIINNEAVDITGNLIGYDIVGNNQLDVPVLLSVGSNTITASFEIDVAIQDIPSFDNLLTFQISNISTPSPDIDIDANSYIEFTSVEVLQSQNLTYKPNGVYVYMTPNSFFGDLTLADIFSNYLNMYSGFISVDDVNKNVTIFPFEYISNNVNNKYNWSDKLDFSKDISISYAASEYANKNYFRYKESNDETKPIGTDGEIIIKSSNVEPEKEYVELDYAATNTLKLLMDITTPTIPVVENGEIKYSVSPRVLLLELKNSADFPNTSPLRYKDTNPDISITTDLPLCRFIDSSESYNLGFGNSLLSNFYADIQNVIQRYKIITCALRLNAADIATLDFTRPVYIQHFNAYFYISQIKGYNPNSAQSTMVELVKLF